MGVGAKDPYVRPVAEYMLVLSLGGLDDHKAGAETAALADQFIDGVAFACTGGACYKRVHGQAVFVQISTVGTDAAHVEDLAQIHAGGCCPPVIADHLFAKIGVLNHRQSTDRPAGQSHVKGLCAAADHGAGG